MNNNIKYIEIPKYCPMCGNKTAIVKENESEVLVCTNSNCCGKLLAKLTHFVSRNCMNIEGLSEATLEFLINKGWVNSFKDIYNLECFKDTWVQCEGYREKSVTKILSAIEKSRSVKLENFICALSIDGVGASMSKTIANHFNNDFGTFYAALTGIYDWSRLSDCGEVTARNIENYGFKFAFDVKALAEEMNFIVEEKAEIQENPFMGKAICVTGKLFNFTRDSINAKISELGAKAAGSVSKNTDYLLTNEASGSSKYKKAVELNVPIITEEEFLRMIGE